MRLLNQKMTDEKLLLKSARRFEEEALAEIYDTLSPAIYGYALRLCGDADIAEECVSETFSRFLVALRGGRGPNEYLKAYLYRTAHNWITDSYRRRRPETVFDPEMRAANDMEPHVASAQAFENREIRSALALLTADQRQVIVLKYFEEMSNVDIAAVIRKPVGAVKSLQHRGLAALKRILDAANKNEADESVLGSPRPNFE